MKRIKVRLYTREPITRRYKLVPQRSIDKYLAEIKTGRKPKTYAAYDVALRYFFECTKNKPINRIVRTDMIDFVPFLCG